MRALRIVGWTMIWAGVVILAFLAYQLVGTNFVTERAQRQAAVELEERFDEVRESLDEGGDLPPSQSVESGEEGPVVLFEEPMPQEGEPFARIVIPDIEVDEVVLEGVERNTLKKGPGHMPWTPLPGQPGNAVISGHRTTYGAPFFDLDSLDDGDHIIVETALGQHVYEVREELIVAPTDVWVTDHRAGAWLTLTTCNPRFSARERLVTVAELVEGPNYRYAEDLLAAGASS